MRRGVAVYHDTAPTHADAAITTTSAFIHDMLARTKTPAQALENGEITVDGKRETIHAFFACFDPQSTEPIRLVAR